MPAITSFATPVHARELEHVRAHHQVRVPVAAGVLAVRADAADLGGEVEDELRPRVGEQPLRVVVARQVVVAPPGDEDVVPVALEPLDEMRAEEPAAAGDEDVVSCLRVRARGAASRRGRASARGCAAYHWIVRRTPSSHETFGSQPVSRCSLS